MFRQGVAIVLLLLLSLSLCSCDRSDQSQVEATPEQATAADAVARTEDDYVEVDAGRIQYVELSDGSVGRVARGQHEQYRYWYVADPAGFHVVRFRPPLARNDEVVTTVFRELVGVLFSPQEAATLDRTAHLVVGPQGNEIALYGRASQYLFLPLKTEMGTIHSTFVRREAW